MGNLKERLEDFVHKGGYWPHKFDTLIRDCPEFVDAYIAFAGRPHDTGSLHPKVRSFLVLALSAASTHLHEPEIERACVDARAGGASRAEIIEVLQLTANLGVHACVLGVPILVEQLSASGKPIDTSNADQRRQDLKDAFIEKRGYWSPIWDGMLALDPEYFSRFIDYSASPWEWGTLEPKVKEFIYIAVNVSAHHQFAPGTHIHIANAIKFGATAAELLEVIQIASVVGMHTFDVALPIVDRIFPRQE